MGQNNATHFEEIVLDEIKKSKVKQDEIFAKTSSKVQGIDAVKRDLRIKVYTGTQSECASTATF